MEAQGKLKAEMLRESDEEEEGEGRRRGRSGYI